MKYYKGHDHLNAVSWAARQAGKNYGEFVAAMTPERHTSILLEYAEMKRQKAAELEEKIQSRAKRPKKLQKA